MDLANRKFEVGQPVLWFATDYLPHCLRWYALQSKGDKSLLNWMNGPSRLLMSYEVLRVPTGKDVGLVISPISQSLPNITALGPFGDIKVHAFQRDEPFVMTQLEVGILRDSPSHVKQRFALCDPELLANIEKYFSLELDPGFPDPREE
jgi:hypothetical protein